MRSFLVLALSSSTLAIPLGNIFDVIYRRAVTTTDEFVPAITTIPTGTGGLPIPTGTGFISTATLIPTGTGTASILPVPTEITKRNAPVHRRLSIKYNLAPTAAPKVVQRVAPEENLEVRKEKRQGSVTTSWSFTLFDPTATATGTVSLPTGTGVVPTGVFPTGGAGSPATLATLTRGPKPTPTNELVPESPEDGAWWDEMKDWLAGVFDKKKED